MTTIYIGMTRTKTIETLKWALDEVEKSEPGRDFNVELHGKANYAPDGDVTIVFSNDDMEERPEVADRMIVDIEGE
jgi:hypothetical protein